MSSMRSRRGGRRSGTTLSRKNRSSRNSPCWIEMRRSLLVAATMRTLVLIGTRPPTVVYSPCWSTRRRRVCASIGMSPISSRNSVPPSACSKRPGAARGRAGEGALLVAEELGFDQVARDRRHVDGDERALAALAVIVQRAGHELLAGAGFAGDHHGEVGRHQPGQRPVDLLHGGRAADQRDVLVLGRTGCAAATRRAAATGRGPTMATSSFRSKGFGRYS